MRIVGLLVVFLGASLGAYAQDIDPREYAGTEWYGLYLNGEKAGYAVSSLEVAEDGTVAISEDAQFLVSMGGMQQDMRIFTERAYGADGQLLRIDSTIRDPSGTTEFRAVADGDTLMLESDVGGASSSSRLPLPSENLAEALKQAAWIASEPAPGDTIEFALFEPMYARELGGTSTVEARESRVFDGVETEVFRVRTRIEALGIESVSFVAEDGTTLEDQVAGIMVMRLEPEEVAKDVDYSNDVIVSNAALVETPIVDARNRESLSLRLFGPIRDEHRFDTSRQTMEAVDGFVAFEAQAIDVSALPGVALPVTDGPAVEWTQPSSFIQSDDPRLIAQAREIVGDETDAFAVSTKLCNWVYDNVNSTFSARLSNALEVLENREGDCTEHSVLFIGLARALGLPAREVAGLIYVDAGPGFYFHQWAMVWVGEWVEVDPTFNQPLADVTHVKLAEGNLFEQARIIPLIGKLRIEVVEEETAAVVRSERVGILGAS